MERRRRRVAVHRGAVQAAVIAVGGVLEATSPLHQTPLHTARLLQRRRKASRQCVVCAAQWASGPPTQRLLLATSAEGMALVTSVVIGTPAACPKQVRGHTPVAASDGCVF